MRRTLRARLLLILALAFGLISVSAVQAIASTPSFSYTGNAFGTSVTVGKTVRSGPSALVVLGCSIRSGVHRSNTVAAVDASPALTTGTVSTTADTSAAAGSVTSRTMAEVQQANLLSSLITADAVRASSATSHDATGFHLSAQGSTFTNLVIGGRSFSATPAPNTTVSLPGVGTVVLNEQTRAISAASAKLTVTMLHARITMANNLGIAIGTQIIVARAESDLEGPIAGVLDGRAYATSAKTGSVVRSGPSALQIMPCLGTNGMLRSNTIAAIRIPNTLTSGTAIDTARGTVSATSAVGEMTSTVQNLNLLSSLVRASAVKADAHAAKSGSTFSFADSGSSFLGLTVNGHPEIGNNVAANTTLRIAGLGTLWLHRVVRTANSIEVRMVEVTVTDAGNSFGLPVGTDIRVAVAEASAH